MYLAEIHGKLSTENENKEDILTSNVFSFFKYADRKIFLLPFLQMLGLEVSFSEALKTEFHFWPTYSEGTQPDLVIISGSYYLLVEAKYHSVFGKATPTRKHQIVREIEVGSFEARNLDKKFYILTVTADYLKPEIDKDVPSEYIENVIWINWQKIAFLIFGILEQNPNISTETKLFTEDLYSLLLKKKLRNFEVTKAFDQIQKLSIYPNNLFFLANTASYRGDFIGFLTVFDNMSLFGLAPMVLFFSKQNADSGEIAHRIRGMSHSKGRKNTGKDIVTLGVRHGAESSQFSLRISRKGKAVSVMDRSIHNGIG